MYPRSRPTLAVNFNVIMLTIGERLFFLVEHDFKAGDKYMD